MLTFLRWTIAAALLIAANAALAAPGDSPIMGGKEGGTDTRPTATDEDTAVTYSGIGLSRVTPGFDNLKTATNLDFGLGLRVPTINWVSAEINFDFTLIPGSNTSSSSGGGGGCGGLLQPPCGSGSGGKFTSSQDDFQMQNIGANIVLRNPGRFYGMARYGWRYLQTTVPEMDSERSGTAYALGLGYRWGKGLSGVEVGYNHYASDLYGYGFNIAYAFGH
jgi:hypothetical protein